MFRNSEAGLGYIFSCDFETSETAIHIFYYDIIYTETTSVIVKFKIKIISSHNLWAERWGVNQLIIKVIFNSFLGNMIDLDSQVVPLSGNPTSQIFEIDIAISI